VGEVVNLRLARKRRDRAEQADQAAANRIVHGRTKAEKLAAKSERKRSDTMLDGHRRDTTPDDAN